mmetsp:Transcript_12172/g.26192  ORF Transcript_12172/g.26192 Transcript_12172/m.26192 type:complete len:239 (+) Transcript_12172:1042-1758(+)
MAPRRNQRCWKVYACSTFTPQEHVRQQQQQQQQQQQLQQLVRSIQQYYFSNLRQQQQQLQQRQRQKSLPTLRTNIHPKTQSPNRKKPQSPLPLLRILRLPFLPPPRSEHDHRPSRPHTLRRQSTLPRRQIPIRAIGHVPPPPSPREHPQHRRDTTRAAGPSVGFQAGSVGVGQCLRRVGRTREGGIAGRRGEGVGGISDGYSGAGRGRGEGYGEDAGCFVDASSGGDRGWGWEGDVCG